MIEIYRSQNNIRVYNNGQLKTEESYPSNTQAKKWIKSFCDSMRRDGVSIRYGMRNYYREKRIS